MIFSLKNSDDIDISVYFDERLYNVLKKYSATSMTYYEILNCPPLISLVVSFLPCWDMETYTFVVTLSKILESVDSSSSPKEKYNHLMGKMFSFIENMKTISDFRIRQEIVIAFIDSFCRLLWDGDRNISDFLSVHTKENGFPELYLNKLNCKITCDLGNSSEN